MDIVLELGLEQEGARKGSVALPIVLVFRQRQR